MKVTPKFLKYIHQRFCVYKFYGNLFGKFFGNPQVRIHLKLTLQYCLRKVKLQQVREKMASKPLAVLTWLLQYVIFLWSTEWLIIMFPLFFLYSFFMRFITATMTDISFDINFHRQFHLNLSVTGQIGI